MLGNSNPDIIIGKDDGSIEIYAVDESDLVTFKKSYVSCEKFFGHTKL